MTKRITPRWWHLANYLNVFLFFFAEIGSEWVNLKIVFRFVRHLSYTRVAF